MLHTGRYAEFTEAEARALIGAEFKVIAPFRGLALYTRGRVVSASLEIPTRIRNRELWRVVIVWETETKGFPVRDWVAKWELEKYLEPVE